MPKATVSQELHHRNLNSLPGGYVKLRTLSFHEMNQRRDIASRLWTEQQVSKKKKTVAPETLRAELEIMNVVVAEYEFRNCIVEHNLEDENGALIDFTLPMQAWRLDPKIGQEISRYIDELNQEDEDDLDPLALSPFSSSPEEMTELEPSMETS